MRIQLLASGALASAAVFATLGGGQLASSSAALAAIGGVNLSAAPGEAVIAPAEAARLAKQGSFGPNQQLIDRIVALKSVSAWLDEQMSLSVSSYGDLASKPVQRQLCAGKAGSEYSVCSRDNYSVVPVAMRFYRNAVSNDDQLRQRVAFALSQILVVSDLEVHTTAGLATYQQILLRNSFGNYRDILSEVTLNPFMGDYLDMASSSKVAPNENYPRELMQLFALGTVLLNQDGTPQLDSSGSEVAAYGNSDVKEVARALTGWSFARLSGDVPDYDYSKPMVADVGRFDAGAKTFLGRTVSTAASPAENVSAVVDAVFNHPNTAPFVSKRLIQQLTVANPSSAYVGRVAAVFSDNGSGVRGDLRAVIQAIYLDSEARVVSQVPGKVKEPILLMTSLVRAIGVTTDGYALYGRDGQIGQRVFSAPSVFNYYPYSYPLERSGGLISPVSKIMNTSTSIYRHNFTYDFTIGGENSRPELLAQPGLTGAGGTQLDWASWEAYGTEDGKIVDRINLVMLNGTMTTAQRQSLLAAMAAVKSSDPATQTRKRAQVALYIAASSPLFQVDR